VEGFKDLFDLANHSYRESLEDMAQERLENPQGNRGSDVLLIYQLNARWPERYRANTEGRESAAKEALQEIREMHRAWKEKLAAEPIEGELARGSDD